MRQKYPESAKETRSVNELQNKDGYSRTEVTERTITRSGGAPGPRSQRQIPITLGPRGPRARGSVGSAQIFDRGAEAASSSEARGRIEPKACYPLRREYLASAGSALAVHDSGSAGGSGGKTNGKSVINLLHDIRDMVQEIRDAVVEPRFQP